MNDNVLAPDSHIMGADVTGVVAGTAVEVVLETVVSRGFQDIVTRPTVEFIAPAPRDEEIRTGTRSDPI